jgi:Xaa-Pro aminopeptidase
MLANTSNGIPVHYQSWLSAEDFAARHTVIYEAIGALSLAVIQGAGPVGGFEIFRQTNEFFYLTGLEVPQAYLVLDGRTKRSTLYVPHRDERHAASEGAELTAEDAALIVQLTGVDQVAGIERLTADLLGARKIYTPQSRAEGNMACQDTLRHAAKLIAADGWENQVSREQFFTGLLKSRLPDAEIFDLSPLLVQMRLHKNPAEIAIMRRTGELTALAVNEAMKATRPGVYEYQLGAVAEYVYRVNGARGEGYRPIIATGENIWFLHYYRNTSVLKDGDWVLMDVAPDVSNYTSDIGRFWPVNGKYNDLQRQLYGYMVKLHQCYLKHLVPGVLPAEIDRRVVADMRPVVDRMKFATAAQEKGVRATLAKPTGLTHTVGMAVHDNGSYKDKPFEPGLVFALDPQMWIPEEKVYVRVEDTVVITANGVENLTPQCPLELDEVEALMRRGPGLLQAFPPVPAKGKIR